MTGEEGTSVAINDGPIHDAADDGGDDAQQEEVEPDEGRRSQKLLQVCYQAIEAMERDRPASRG
jgi:hypothetical protein